LVKNDLVVVESAANTSAAPHVQGYLKRNKEKKEGGESTRHEAEWRERDGDIEDVGIEGKGNKKRKPANSSPRLE
jgi:hypothetical protein